MIRALISLCAIVLILLLQGCESKKTLNKCEIPQTLLNVPSVDLNRSINTQSETALFMLDLYEAYEKCAINLKSIKRLQNGK
ncbi:hypothetical protein OFN70_07420 [Campylobacter sp. CN_NE3]|uniref:hypothetical protein n=1 Tax=Campylobacter sp. CN_NE3 TaxID=2984149 RepID=UPI0022E9F6B8|nr:hypothetical protein [Campylobacter sp. CN_NE3]MDA3056421.1 hypothetical protein [Campylobacter sp. CN_NA1]MDA3069353.1 hypothetical protein [Campylobacter sp. CN_NE3]